MLTRADIVSEARQWVGTRWQHQATVKGVACDCAGLLRGVLIEVGWLRRDFENIPEVLPFMGYGRSADGATMQKACGLFMQVIDRNALQLADVVLFATHGTPNHVGFISDYPARGEVAVIHAHLPSRKVIEHRLDETWRARIVGAYRIPGVA